VSPPRTVNTTTSPAGLAGCASASTAASSAAAAAAAKRQRRRRARRIETENARKLNLAPCFFLPCFVSNPAPDLHKRKKTNQSKNAKAK
jgi:hypothetical protein